MCLGAALVGALVAVGVFAVLPDRGPKPTESISAVRSDLLEHWERWRRAAVTFTESSVRTSGSQKLADRADIAQRFPDRIVRDGDDISAEIDGRAIGCSVGGSEPPRCLDGGPADPAAQLASEMREFRTLTEGARPNYRVSRTGASCFRLRHLVQEVRPRWGDQLDLCFDDRTGVLRSEVTTTGPLTISVTRSDVGVAVDDADFKLPAAPA